MFQSLIRQWLASQAMGAVQDALVKELHSSGAKPARNEGETPDGSDDTTSLESAGCGDDSTALSRRDTAERQTGSLKADVGMVFAMPMEAAGVVDRLEQSRTFRGDGLRFHSGRFCGHHVAVVESGIGQEKALAAAERLIRVFRPDRLLSAGYAGGLRKLFQRNQLLIPSRLVRAADGEVIELPGCENVERPISLLTCDQAIKIPAEKRKLAERFEADVVDMETWAIAQLCTQQGIPFLTLRIVLDTATEELGREVQRVVDSGTSGNKVRVLGSVVGAMFRKPSSLIDLYQLKERALVATDKLSRGIERLLETPET